MSPPFDSTSGEPMRVGVIGVGQRGGAYARALARGEVRGAKLAGVCDVRPEALEPFRGVERFTDAGALVRDGSFDAVVVATPHKSHEEPSLLALSAGLGVLTEKPLCVDVAGAERLVRAHAERARADRPFATALVLRADARYRLLRSWLRDGALGRVQRIAWTVTDCFRTDAYYRSADWRGTFAGEGGGLLVNQCSHQLDLWQWLFGMPRRVRAFLGLGRHHSIEVEDQVTAYLEHEGGATGVFVASTGEAPGTNRLEVALEVGKVVIEGDQVDLWKNAVPTPERIRQGAVREPVAPVEHERLSVPQGGVGPVELLQNFVDAAVGRAELLAPASDGIASIELANALLASGLAEASVLVPLDRAELPRALVTAWDVSAR